MAVAEQQEEGGGGEGTTPPVSPRALETIRCVWIHNEYIHTPDLPHIQPTERPANQ